MRRPWWLIALAASCGGVDVPAHEDLQQTLEGLVIADLVAFTPEDDLLPSVSADGRYVLFASEQNGNLDVWVRDYAKSSTFPITKSSSADDYDPKIAPGGDRMAFVSRRSDAKGDIFLSDVDSESGIERLTDDKTHDRQPAWSPDGETIYFTAAYGIGLEQIAKIDLDSKTVTRVSPGGGFDPAVSPDGRYLVYTEPPGGRRAEDIDASPRLVALELANGSTRALTLGEAPEGFAAFIPAKHLVTKQVSSLVYVRFADDDNRDGVTDAEDQASVWRIDVDLDALFRTGKQPADPVPLTDGNDDELFPTADDGWLYITRGTVQQDIARLPLTGMFPTYDDPASYFELANTIEDLRTRWFVLRIAHARAEKGSLLRAQAGLRIANLHLERDRPDLALSAFLALREETKNPVPRSAVHQLTGLVRAEIVAIQHDERLALVGAELREVEIKRTREALGAIRSEFAWTDRVVARVDLELAELLVDENNRVAAIEAFDRLIEVHGSQTFSASRASLRRIELLGVAHDASAIGEAYQRVLERFPDQVDIVREASRRIVDVHVRDLGTSDDWVEQVDALRQIVGRYGESPVRVQARWRLAELLESHEALDGAALEYAQIVREAGRDRLTAARATAALPLVDERRGRLDEAAAGWRELRAKYSDVPGFASRARGAITRVNLQRAAEDEASGNLESARGAYKRVIENDLTQVKAHRRYLALSAATGHLDEALDEAEARAEQSPGTPIARYAYGLALSWADPPRIDDAWEEIAESIRLNPQLSSAYVTRGWLRERREQSPGLFESIKRGVIQSVGQMIGGLVDVEIGKQGELELALEDYKTALRLNSEATEPEAEAEILLNLGNAHYTLAEQTQDVSNMRLAFDRYVELIRFGYDFHNPTTEAIFWERLGRSAIWADEPAISAMATRRAIDLVSRAGLEIRLAQLQGNLALAYANAGENAYAQRALDSFDDALRKRNLEERLIIAVRDRARSRLQTIDGRTPRSLDQVLRELAAARAILARTQKTGRGEAPDVWVGVVGNHSSAQFGFRAKSELDVNLALAEMTHAALNEQSRVRAIRDRRIEVTADILDTIPTKYTIPREPVALIQIRERLGLMTSAARSHLDRGAFDVAFKTYDGALEALNEWRKDDGHAADFGALDVDRGRLLAQIAEAKVKAGSADLSKWPAQLKAAREQILASLDLTRSSTVNALLLTNQVLDTLPAVLTSTGALVRTTSIALGTPQLQAPMLDARAVRARLFHAEGLVTMVSARARLRSTAPNVAAMLRALDETAAASDAAQALFERAVREAAGAGAGRGGPILVSALQGVWETGRWASDRRPSHLAYLQRVRETASEVAKAIGRDDLDTSIRLAEAATKTATVAALVEEELRTRGPHTYLSVRRMYSSLIARTASSAISRGAIGPAISAIDRWLLVEQVSASRVESLEGLADTAASAAYVRLLDRLAELRAELRAADVSVGAEAFADIITRIRTTRAAIADLEENAPIDMTEGGLARLFATPQAPDFIALDLSPSQIIVAPVPIAGRLHLAVVDGSTTAAQLAVIPTTLPFESVTKALHALRTSLATGYADAASIELLRSGLIVPIASRLKNKETLIFASALLGGPVPSLIVEQNGIALTHVSSLSSLAQARRAQLVGVEGTFVLAGPNDAAIFDGGRRLTGRELIAFRRADANKKLELGEARSLESRTAYERYASHAVDTVVVESELVLEPAAMGRSAIRVLTSTGTDTQLSSSEADRFESEVPLDSLDLPARHLVLARVQDKSLGTSPNQVPAKWLLALDLPLASKGFATTVIVPTSVSAASARRVVTAYLESALDLGPARALAKAIADARPLDPSVDLITLLGAPGLDRAKNRQYAKSRLKAARAYAIDRLKKQRYEELVPALERWIRLQFEAGDISSVKLASTALVGTLSDKLNANERAADAMAAYVAFQESTSTKKRKVAESIVDLASLYSLAHDYEKAEATFTEAIGRLDKLDDRLGVARGWFKFGRHYKDKLELDLAAQYLERSVALYEKLGQYDPKTKRVLDADLALRQVGDLYLKSMSDPVRAQRAYERALKYAKDDDQRIDRTIDLARVARRRGDFDVAAERAEAARQAAKEKGLGTRELSGIIEAANVAWYRGDYQRGQVLCEESLALAQRLYAAAAKSKQKAADKRSVQRLEIYARSVCGLVAMSQRDAQVAIDHLMQARRIAERIRDEREVATQYNNLGRVYLEFGRRQDALEAFRAALAIDTKLEDRYALAYDLRNLGRVLALEGDNKEAKKALDRGLQYAIVARDTNNELRARFALAQLAQDEKRYDDARKLYALALPLAERLDVRDLAWQTHHALGLMDRESGDVQSAERRFAKAVEIARTISGRATSSEIGPNRLQAFDDLMSILLDRGRTKEAFEVAGLARSIGQSSLFDDQRVPFDKNLFRLLSRLRTTTTASVAATARAQLRALRPRVADVVEPVDVDEIVRSIPKDAAIVVYRLTSSELVAFVITPDGLTAHRTATEPGALETEIVAYADHLVARADLDDDQRRLAEHVIKPIEGVIGKASRLALVLDGPLRYVAFPALPFGDGALIDRFVLIHALHPIAAMRGLRAPAPSMTAMPIASFGASSVALGTALKPLPFADKELDVIHEEFPKATVVRGDLVTRAKLSGAFKSESGVIHFAGHTRFAGGRGGVVDPLGGKLTTSDGGLSVIDLLGLKTSAQLVVLSACFSLLAPFADRVAPLDGNEILSFAQALHLAGAQYVLATMSFVDDLSASIVMKRFYRAARAQDAATALREAQQRVRERHPHPAWWATFSLTSG